MTKIIRTSLEAIAMIIRRELIPATGDKGTVKSTPSIMDDTSVHVLK